MMLPCHGAIVNAIMIIVIYYYYPQICIFVLIMLLLHISANCYNLFAIPVNYVFYTRIAWICCV